MQTLTVKRCSKCRETLPITVFNKHSKNGHQAYCRACNTLAKKEWRHAHPGRQLATVLRHYHRHKEAIDAKRRGHYCGWTTQQIADLLLKQDNCCAICKTTNPGNRGWFLDHQHGAKKVRGILCLKCNAGLGFFNDQPGVLRNAADYIEASY